MSEPGAIHHLELWVENIDLAESEWGWLLGRLGYRCVQRWAAGQSWQRDHTYIVLESGPDRAGGRHDRRRVGINHIAFHAGSRERVDALVEEAPARGWTLMFPDRHPFAGGDDHYAAYLENTEGFEVELVVD